tara:strand:+ start:5390 stop:6154 length:765 start_codon:yes stop_codon:yes gene_type:complete
MKIVINDATKCKQFQTLFNLLSTICDDVNINIRENEMFIQGMDMGHICLFELNITSAWFDEYNYDKDAPIFGVKLSILSKILSCLGDKQNITIDNKRQDKLNIYFNSEELYKCFEMCLFDFDIEMLEIPNVTYDADITLNSSIINSILSELFSFGSVVEINTTEEYMNFKSKYNTNETQVENRLNISDLEEYAIIEDGNITQEFSLQYLQKIVQFSKLSNEVEINFSEGLPLKFKYNLSDNDNVSIWISPRVNN